MRFDEVLSGRWVRAAARGGALCQRGAMPKGCNVKEHEVTHYVMVPMTPQAPFHSHPKPRVPLWASSERTPPKRSMTQEGDAVAYWQVTPTPCGVSLLHPVAGHTYTLWRVIPTPCFCNLFILHLCGMQISSSCICVTCHTYTLWRVTPTPCSCNLFILQLCGMPISSSCICVTCHTYTLLL